MNHQHYRHLFIMTILSFISMYILMYAMVNALGNVYNSVNQIYIAGLMTAPMVVFELVVMRGMYPDTRRNVSFSAPPLESASSSRLSADAFALGQGGSRTERPFHGRVMRSQGQK
jgi:hypothetical protein